MQVVIGFLGFTMQLELVFQFKTIHDITKIDFWFLRQIEELVVFENEIKKHSILNQFLEIYYLKQKLKVMQIDKLLIY